MLIGNRDILNIGLFWGGVVFGMVSEAKNQEALTLENHCWVLALGTNAWLFIIEKRNGTKYMFDFISGFMDDCVCVSQEKDLNVVLWVISTLYPFIVISEWWVAHFFFLLHFHNLKKIWIILCADLLFIIL